MKTIEEFKTEVFEVFGTGDEYLIRAVVNMSVEFAQRWIHCSEELPNTYESGDWDGLRSEFVIALWKDGDWTKARLYSGILDGEKFNDWYDESDAYISGITHFRYIEIK